MRSAGWIWGVAIVSVAVVGGLALIGGIVLAASGNGAGATLAVPPPKPTVQDFCRVIDAYAGKYRSERDDGANELKITKIKVDRRKALNDLMTSVKVENWPGTLEDAHTTSDQGFVTVGLGCENPTVVKSAIHVLGPDTRLPPSSAAFDDASNLEVHAEIVFSGSFVRDSEGLVSDNWVQESEMTKPAFVFRFTSLKTMDVKRQ